MMTYAVMIFVLAISAVIQTMLPDYAISGHAKFPLLLAVALYYALHRNMRVAIISAFLAGFLQDVLSPVVPLGYSVLCFCAAGLIVGRLRNFVLSESIATSIFFGFITGAAVTLGMYILLIIKGLIALSVAQVALKIIFTGIFGMFCAPLMFFITRKIECFVGNVEPSHSQM